MSEQISALADNLVQASFGLRQDAVPISVWGQLPPAADVHLGIQTVGFLVRNQLRVCRRLQRLVLERALLFRGRADRDRKRVQNSGALLLNVN